MAKKQYKRKRPRQRRGFNLHEGRTRLRFLVWGLFIFCAYQLISSYVESRYQAYNNDNEAYSISHEDFITKIANYARENYATSQVLPSVVIAQACLESNFGTSQLAQDYHNLFGVKAGEGSHSVTLPTLEYNNEDWQDVDAAFAVYPSWREAVIAHGSLMINGTDWDAHLYDGVRGVKDYRSATAALAKAGYATDPNYAGKLNAIIEQYDLTRFDDL